MGSKITIIYFNILLYKFNSIIKTIKATILKGSLEMQANFISSSGWRSKGFANFGELLVGLNIKYFSSPFTLSENSKILFSTSKPIGVELNLSPSRKSIAERLVCVFIFNILHSRGIVKLLFECIEWLKKEK